jgi:hypothetical protein
MNAMHISPRYLAPFLMAGAAAAITAAPMATAAVTCIDVGSATQCGSPGNSQITANAPVVQQQPEIIIIHRNHR